MMLTEQPEGATPLDDYSGLKIDWVKNKQQLDAVEANNITFAVRTYLGKRRYRFPGWYTVKNFNAVHKRMFGKVWSWAGKYRTTEKSIGIAPYQIHLEMKKLERELIYWANDPSFSPIEISARTHHRLVWITHMKMGMGDMGVSLAI